MISTFEIEKTLKRFKPLLEERYGVKRIGFFDLYIDRNHNPMSEVNILVELNKPLGWQFFKLKQFLEVKLDTRIDICTQCALKPALKNEILNATKFV